MRIGIRRNILGAYLVVLALGIALSAFIYSNGNAVLEASRPFLREDLPLLKDISDLKTAVVRQELLFFEYYSSAERERFVREYEAVQRQIDDYLRSISMNLMSRDYVTIWVAHNQLKLLAQQLDAALSREELDRRHASVLLTQVGMHGRQMYAELDDLVMEVQKRVFGAGAFTEVKIRQMVTVVILFSLVIFIIALFVGFYVNAFIADVQKRRRLALFAEKNPNPVLRLSLDGEVRYANPAAAAMLRRIGADPSAPRGLLPQDLAVRLARMRESATEFERWDYAVGEFTLGCGIHYLPRYRMFHAYMSDITERKRAERKLIYQAGHDALTGLPNRRRFQEMLEQAMSAATGGGHGAVLLLNLDRFGLINGSVGHVVGDRLLRAVAERLQRSVEECRGDGCLRGTLFRFEADTFCVLLTEIDCGREPVTLAERMTGNMAEPFYAAGHEFFVTASIGIGVFPSDGKDAVALVQKADMALQCAKRRGGNGHQSYTPEMDASAADRLAVENGLRRALELKELSLLYQPQVDIGSGRVIGSEVLLRWTNAERGPVSPAAFIPVAEETGLIVPIGEWVLRTACCQHRRWREQGLAAGVVAVNISARQFHHPGFTRMVAEAIADSGLEPQHLELEITESVAMQNAEITIATLRELKATGVKLSIDDFGTGYSSLSYMKRFPIDKLKVDQSFVRNMTEDANDAAIARAVISLGHSLNLKVIAEGVETDEHLRQLRRHGCDEIQGYLFSRPLPAADMAALLAEGRRLQAADGSSAPAVRFAAA